MAKITYIIGGKSVEVDAKVGKSLLQIGLDANLSIVHSCGGNGFCTTCSCTVKTSATMLSAINDNEESMGINEPLRLTCQAVVTADEPLTIELTE